jgi:hypothetical protein
VLLAATSQRSGYVTLVVEIGAGKNNLFDAILVCLIKDQTGGHKVVSHGIFPARSRTGVSRQMEEHVKTEESSRELGGIGQVKRYVFWAFGVRRALPIKKLQIKLGL